MTIILVYGMNLQAETVAFFSKRGSRYASKFKLICILGRGNGGDETFLGLLFKIGSLALYEKMLKR